MVVMQLLGVALFAALTALDEVLMIINGLRFLRAQRVQPVRHCGLISSEGRQMTLANNDSSIAGVFRRLARVLSGHVGAGQELRWLSDFRRLLEGIGQFNQGRFLPCFCKK